MSFLGKLMNSDVEHSLCFLASDFDGHLEITNMQSSQGNADTCSIFRPSDWFLERAKDNRTLLSGHVHYTKNGTVIEDAMPYWTLPQGLGYVPRVIINDEFFVGRKQTMRGDTEALLGMSTYFWDCFKIENRLTIFVHPQYDSHGGLMSPNLMQVSCYELDPLAKFGVRPIEVNFG